MDSELEEICKYHVSIFLPNVVTSKCNYWQGCLQDLKLKTLNLPRKTLFFIKKLTKRLPYVFYSKQHGLEKTQLWIGKPKCEEEALDISNASKFVIGVHTSESIHEIVYEECLKCARYNGRQKERTSICIPIYIGVNAPSSVTLLNRTVHLNDKMKHEDFENVKKIALYIERCILWDCLNSCETPVTCSDTTLVPAGHPKKYLYCMIGDTQSKEAKEFQQQMEGELLKYKASSTVYEGFWDWESEFGTQMEDQFEEKLENSHFVIAIFKDKDTFVDRHNLQAAFKYHLERSSDGNTERYIPIVLSGIEMPINLQIMSALHFSANHCTKTQWGKLTRTICDNLSMLQVSPFQKFDYCVHEGLNLLQKVSANDKLTSKCRMLDLFILHNQGSTNDMLDNMITELIDIQNSGKDCNELSGKYMCSMKERTNFIIKLLKEAFEQLTTHFNKTNMHFNTLACMTNFIFVSNKIYMSAKLLHSQMPKLVFVTQNLGQDIVNPICDIADLLRSSNLCRDIGPVIADMNFPSIIQHVHLDNIINSFSDIPVKLQIAIDDIDRQMHSLTDMTCHKCIRSSHVGNLRKLDELKQLHYQLESMHYQRKPFLLLTQYIHIFLSFSKFVENLLVLVQNTWTSEQIRFTDLEIFVEYFGIAVDKLSNVLEGTPPYYLDKLNLDAFECQWIRRAFSILTLDMNGKIKSISNKDMMTRIKSISIENMMTRIKSISNKHTTTRHNDSMSISKRGKIKMSRRNLPKVNKERHKVNVVRLFKRSYKR